MRTVLSPVFAGALALVLSLFGAGGAVSQDMGKSVSQIVIVDRERLFSGSAYGQRVLAELEIERSRLAAETREIEQALEAEEKALADDRATLEADVFRAKADAFDAKVQALRSERVVTEQNFVRRNETAQLAFYDEIGPLLGQLLREMGAVVILDRRVILLTTQNIDITDLAITRINQVLGDGTQPDGQGPAPAAPDAPSTTEAPATDN
ncbi:OmpH family outer membrane protein [Aliiroseovarius subalbicans]|uniref:OmpH family outer membrane protein n=1 Tax=Aliiroseovarius subalbicans TaxID=2925840 RepID=UPI001F56785B|nr:OmpH family outer membrane protein [Aliiroseovarius subalbicans]MCI2398370.1 OmpH family outer membrane protein [Aliiroseovarius subalbicans]